ncbi:MAG: hypothetical protein FWE61_02565 [Micrococcales bacterium]|nr:hypothetical protein [Micrococcales bacterium]
MAEHTATLVPQPGVLYRVRLADGTEVDYYTNALGQICYVETAQARVGCRNAVLERPYPAATFVVHPTAGMDRQHSHVLRTDDRGRLTLALVETLAPTHDPLTDLFGRGTELVTVPAMFAAVRTPTADPFGPLASELAQAVNQGSAVGLRITAVHDDSAGTSIQVEWTIDGQPGTQTIATR